MPSLFDKTTQDEMLARVDKLKPDSLRLWGKMSVSQMLKHMSIAFSVTTGKVELPKDKLFYLVANPFSRWVMVHVLTRWPKNMATVDSFKIKEDPEFEKTKTDFSANVNEFLKATTFHGSHPAFGVMSQELWGKAMYIHLDHHLRQFGV